MPVSGLASWQILDADGEVASFDLPFVNTSSLLADIITFLTTNVTPSLDLITDGQLRKLRLTLTITLPGTIKAAPNAGAENERTGLYTLLAAGTPNAYGLDIPSFALLGFNANQINQSAANAVSWKTVLTTTQNNCYVTDRYGNQITTVRSAVKTFRKHRKALKRA